MKFGNDWLTCIPERFGRSIQTLIQKNWNAISRRFIWTSWIWLVFSNWNQTKSFSSWMSTSSYWRHESGMRDGSSAFEIRQKLIRCIFSGLFFRSIQNEIFDAILVDFAENAVPKQKKKMRGKKRVVLLDPAGSSEALQVRLDAFFLERPGSFISVRVFLVPRSITAGSQTLSWNWANPNRWMQGGERRFTSWLNSKLSCFSISVSHSHPF